MGRSRAGGGFQLTPDEALEFIARGESQSLEFKETLRFDTEGGRVNRDLTKVVAKSLAGFLNTHGGKLMIGVRDDGEVMGIERDINTLSQPDLDGFERTLRNAVSNHLGVGVGPALHVEFIDISGRVVVVVSCERHYEETFLRDGERQDFFIRDGNQTKPLDVRAAHEYIRTHWPPEFREVTDAIREVVQDTLRQELGISSAELRDQPSIEPAVELGEAEELIRAAVSHAGTSTELPTVRSEPQPLWMRVATRRVIDAFLKPLAGSRSWKRLYIISPWISRFDEQTSISFDQLVQRLIQDEATAYVVTRPPEESWHAEAIESLGNSGRVNVALVPELHVKLFTALTAEGSLAMLGSANFTGQSLTNREIGVLVNSYAEGKRVIARLNREASEIYRLPGRELTYKASFST